MCCRLSYFGSLAQLVANRSVDGSSPARTINKCAKFCAKSFNYLLQSSYFSYSILLRNVDIISLFQYYQSLLSPSDHGAKPRPTFVVGHFFILLSCIK